MCAQSRVVKHSLGLQLLLLICQASGYLDELFEGSPCTMEDNSQGICTKISQCESRIKQIKLGITFEIGTGHCSWEGFEQIVCCDNDRSRINQPPESQTDTDIAYEDRPATKACSQYRTLHKQLKHTQLTYHIIGGKEVENEELPYVVALGYEDAEGRIQYNCGGTLITERHVLTAAHCVSNIQQQVPIQVRAGGNDLTSTSSDDQIVPIARLIKHPEYRFSANYHDIALIELETNMTLSPNVVPVCLQTQVIVESRDSIENPYIVAGWGLTSFDGDKSPVLLKTPGLELLSPGACNASYANFGKLPNGLSDDMICAVDPNKERSADACHGDSGGPLLHAENETHTLIGVTSFGQSCGSSIPSVYMAVLPYLDWIEKVVWV